MGAALASMVARLTLHRQDYAAVHEEMEQLLQQTERLRHRFEELMQEDIAAYGKLSAAYKMPRGTDEEKEVRSRTIQEQLVEAALVPLEAVENAAELVDVLSERLGRALDSITVGNQRVTTIVGERA